MILYVCIDQPPLIGVRKSEAGWMRLGPNGGWDVAQRIYRGLRVHMILLPAIIFFGVI